MAEVTWDQLSELQRELLEAGYWAWEWETGGVSLRSLSPERYRAVNELMALRLLENPLGQAHVVVAMSCTLIAEEAENAQEAPHA